MNETMELNDVCMKRTGCQPDTIKIVAKSPWRDEVICEARIPLVGLQYAREFARTLLEASPWTRRSHRPRYEIWRDGEMIAAGELEAA